MAGGFDNHQQVTPPEGAGRDNPAPAEAFRIHKRSWHNNLYVYPVVSRRSRGLSVGVNLNPDKACNFDCVYCQVDRRLPPPVRKVDPAVLERELSDMLDAASGPVFQDPAFGTIPPGFRRLNDIAFSGDGEPTACPQFGEAVAMAARLKDVRHLHEVKIVLITDACYLTKPAVMAGLETMDANQGEVWAKLDAGTEEYYQRVNRPNFPLRHVIDNITATARVRPIVIQSLWIRLHGRSPQAREYDAYIERLREIVAGGGRISLVQLYSVARRPAEAFVTALPTAELHRLADTVRTRTGIAAEVY